MKTRVAFLTLFISLLSPALLQAGSESHGGHIIACFPTKEIREQVLAVLLRNQKDGRRDDPLEGVDLSQVKAQSIDLEVERRRGLDPKTAPVLTEFPQELDPNRVEDLIAFARSRIAYMKDKTDLYDDFILAFDETNKPERWIRTRNGVAVTLDSGRLANYSAQCLPMNIAVQSAIEVEVDERLFNILDPLDRSSLFLHEALWKIAKNLGHTTSEAIQAFVGFMMRKNYESLSGFEIAEEAGRLNLFAHADLIYSGRKEEIAGEQVLSLTYSLSRAYQEDRRGLWLTGEEPSRANYPNGAPKSRHSYGNQMVQGYPVKNKTFMEFYENGKLKSFRNGREFVAKNMTIPEGFKFQLYENGNFKSIEQAHESAFKTDLSISYAGLQLVLKVNSYGGIRFYENGSLEGGFVTSVVALQTPKELKNLSGSTATFYPGSADGVGRLKSLEIFNSVRLQHANGGWIQVPKSSQGTRVEFNEEGLVIKPQKANEIRSDGWGD